VGFAFPGISIMVKEIFMQEKVDKKILFRNNSIEFFMREIYDARSFVREHFKE
jgi:hypothetical protein